MLSLKVRKNLTGFGMTYIIETGFKKPVRFSQLMFNLTLAGIVYSCKQAIIFYAKKQQLPFVV
jgi:hypothetical protein